MIRNIVSIAELSTVSDAELGNVSIKASVSIRSIRHGTNRHAYFYMDLRDGSGDITAVAYADNEPCDNQLHRIRDNRTYIFANFTLNNSKKRYTSILNEKEIVLNEDSTIKLCGNAPRVEWPLTTFHEVFEQETTKLFNIIGLCTAVAEKQIVQDEITRRVTLIDEFRQSVTLNVWNQEVSLFDDLDLNFQPVFFVKDARIYKHRGETGLTTSRYLQLLEPDDPRAVKIRKALLPRDSSTNHNMNTSQALVRFKTGPTGTSIYCTPSNYTKKHRIYVKVSDLCGDVKLDTVTIIATVTITSMRHGKNERAYFHMDLRDESGEIVAVALDEACVKFHHFIEKNKTYSITAFSLVNSDKRGTSIRHPKLLVLKHDSEVKLCGHAPKVEWPLSPLTVVTSEDNTEYYHAFGRCTNIMQTQYVKALDKTMRQITLVDQLGRELILKVWDKETAVFDALDPDTHPVIFVKDARILDSELSSTVLTTNKYLELLDPDDPRACRITKSRQIQGV